MSLVKNRNNLYLLFAGVTVILLMLLPGCSQVLQITVDDSLKLQSLNGSEVLKGGNSTEIRWQTGTTLLEENPIDIYYSSNNGSSWSIIAQSIKNTGSYYWTTPTLESQTYKIKVVARAKNGSSYQAISATAFAIDNTYPILELKSLNGGSVIKGGSIVNITWSAYDTHFSDDPVSIYYSLNNGSTWIPIATSVANTGNYNWTAPTIDNEQVKVKIVATDLIDQSSEVISQNYFSIDSTAPSLSLLSFNSGGIFAGDTNQNITWSAADAHFFINPIYIEISSDSGASWSPLAGPLSNTGSFSWNLSQIDGAQYRIRLRATDAVGQTTVVSSSVDFSISRLLPGLTQTSYTSPYYSNTDTQLTFTGACQTGINVIVSGVESAIVPCPAGTWTHITAVYAAEASRDFNFAQTNGSGTINIPFTWIRDTTNPSLTFIEINEGAYYAGSPLVNVKVTATDTYQNSLLVRFALALAGDCQSQYANNNWLSQETPTKTHKFTFPNIDSIKKICAWSKDAAGNVTMIAPASGTNGVNYDEIAYFVNNIPNVNSFNVQNANDSSSDYTLGDPVEITWNATDAEGLDNNPVQLSYTIDNINWTPIISNYGGLIGNPTTYNGSYLSFTAPSSNYFRLRIIVTDNAGNTSTPILSEAQNTTPWTVYAGTNSIGVGGSALSTRLNAEKARSSNIAIHPVSGDIYMVTSDGIIIMDANTGLTSWFAEVGTWNIPDNGSLPSTVYVGIGSQITFDSNGYLYIKCCGKNRNAPEKVHQINLVTRTAKFYAGGGTGIDGTATPSTVHMQYGNFVFDESNSMYFLINCIPGVWDITTSAARMLKLTQNPDGTPGTISVVAGNCTKGVPSSGVAAISNPISNNPYPDLWDFDVANNGQHIFFMNPTDKVLKIINGTTYSSTIATNQYGGLLYDKNTNTLYYSGIVDSGLSTYTLNLAGAGGDVLNGTFAAGNGAGSSCLSDGTLNTNSCVVVGQSLEFNPVGTVIFMDGPIVNNLKPYRVRYVDSDNKMRTLSGHLPFYGDGQHKSVIQGQLGGIYYKRPSEPNQAAFPAGLYFVESQGLVFSRIDPITEINAVLIGDQTGGSTVHPTGTAMSKTISMGVPYVANGKAMTFDENGLPWFRYNTVAASVDNTGNLVARQNASFSPWAEAALGTDPLNYSMYVSAGQNNFTVYNDILYMVGRYYNGTTYPNDNPLMREIDFGTADTRHIMGDNGITSSPDTVIAANIPTSSIDRFCLFGSCPTQYVALEDRLYWAEDMKMRFINNMTIPGSRELHTIFTAPSNIRNFIMSLDSSMLFYILADGNLYCHDMDGIAIASFCTDTIIGPPPGMDKISKGPNQLTWESASILYISNYSGLIYRLDLSGL